ncbi:PFGI-1 class ICE element type IV pilus protein PilL2 [Vibrio parahaemolyticus]|uniref:PFGI-1 class ICE element type IV pilus protein PilL2 n=1 Tax=Vibrio parahaemolyticus TaxID=670 RepID=UPI00215CF0D4|nr:hypothetical protein [Vibrio parahaemolyticus]EGQ8533394.1 hypothetical protein [Vibrio parahaemolyticus]EJB8506694.1 hypothetical protein [Vibrio parahaemolyticus]EJL3960528.1 hypothetical protein [Vibrio parahaemolyticus]MCR9867975.1 hypothetical protein [Vibrio parahaemolyticus]
MQKRWFALSVVSVLVGCTSTPPPAPTPPPLNVRTAPELSAGQAVHTSRYVTQSRASGAELTDILGVPIDARLPVMTQMTVKQGMEFLLNGSGMALRTPTSGAEAQLYTQALPLGQTNMGHMSLREALQVMGGQAFLLEEDVVRREVGFRLKDGYVWQAPLVAGVGNMPPSSSTGASNSDVVMTPRLNQSLAANGASSASSSASLSNDELFMENGKPTVSSASKSTATSKTVMSHSPAEANTNYFISKGEAPYHAIQRWFESKKFARVAFALDDKQQAALLDPLEQSVNYHGTLPEAIAELGKQLELPLHFDMQRGIAAIHTLDVVPDIQWVHGNTLKQAVANLARSYGWQWQDDGAQASWMSDNDYPLMSEFGVVTPRGAFDEALDTVLDGYPVKAQLIAGTRQVFIREKE